VVAAVEASFSMQQIEESEPYNPDPVDLAYEQYRDDCDREGLCWVCKLAGQHREGCPCA